VFILSETNLKRAELWLTRKKTQPLGLPFGELNKDYNKLFSVAKKGSGQF